MYRRNSRAPSRHHSNRWVLPDLDWEAELRDESSKVRLDAAELKGGRSACECATEKAGSLADDLPSSFDKHAVSLSSRMIINPEPVEGS